MRYRTIGAIVMLGITASAGVMGYLSPPLDQWAHRASQGSHRAFIANRNGDTLAIACRATAGESAIWSGAINVVDRSIVHEVVEPSSIARLGFGWHRGSAFIHRPEEIPAAIESAAKGQSLVFEIDGRAVEFATAGLLRSMQAIYRKCKESHR